MQYALSLAALVAVASAFPQLQARGNYTTSTVYKTNTYTITQCPATVTNCPVESKKVTTEVVVDYTTVCPVEEASSTPVVYTTAAPAPVYTYSAAPVPVITTYSAAPAPATATPIAPGAPVSYSVASPVAPAPAPTGTVASVAPVAPAPTSSPIAKGAGAKLGASIVGGVALVAAALML